MASLPIVSAHRFLPCFATPSPGKSRWAAKKGRIRASHKELQVLYDDGYKKPFKFGDYVDAVSDLIQFDRGPPRWFCPVDCGPPTKDSPLLLFLPGVDGIGLGLYRHHKALGRIFEVRCMHVPFSDRTSFEGFVKFVEDALKMEQLNSQNKPIYLVGHSLGGCLALSVAARNPNIYLILILSNPATPFGKARIQSFLPIIGCSPFGVNTILPFISSHNLADHQVKLALGNIDSGQSPLKIIDKFWRNVTTPLIRITDILDVMPEETVSWKLKLIESAAADANSRLHAVNAEVVLLASCLDTILPSKDEADRLQKSLAKCKVHYFTYHGHSLLLENDVHLSSIIKGACLYRHSRKHDFISDYLPPSLLEFDNLEKWNRWFHEAASPAVFSTLDDGRIVRGLSGLPDNGPVLLVGNHLLLGIDLIPLFMEFLREKKAVLRGIAHPTLFTVRNENSFNNTDIIGLLRSFYGVPLSFKNIYRLFSENSFILLYPGGSREGLHRKGEEHKLLWSDKPEFVRMAARFGASIVPFGAVGEDDLVQLLLDYDDLMNMPIMRESIIEANQKLSHPDSKIFGEMRNQDLFWPWILPKVPGRMYYLFGRPIITRGRLDIAKSEEVNAMYWHVKSEVDRLISYLIKKRGEDKFRSVFHRALYQAISGPTKQIPSFEP